jgi:hypothetical protein
MTRFWGEGWPGTAACPVIVTNWLLEPAGKMSAVARTISDAGLFAVPSTKVLLKVDLSQPSNRNGCMMDA